MAVFFRTEGVATTAAPGDVIMDVAARCGVEIPGGCYSGSCGIWEVEVFKLKTADDDNAAAGAAAAAGDGGGGGGGGRGAVVRACVARLPPGYARVEVESLQDDQIWGLDGFDT